MKIRVSGRKKQKQKQNKKKNSKVLTLIKKFSNFARLHVTLIWEPKISVSQKKKKKRETQHVWVKKLAHPALSSNRVYSVCSLCSKFLDTKGKKGYSNFRTRVVSSQGVTIIWGKHNVTKAVFFSASA